MRLTVANPGAFDMRFAVLAVGVTAIAGAGALIVSMIGSAIVPPRPVAQVVAGLDHDHAKVALAKEALPDSHGQLFMATLKARFPSEHDKLLGQMADTALAGGDRNSLAIDVNEWLAPFAVQNISNLGRTGSAGFDFALDTGDETLKYISSLAGGCTMASSGKLQELFSDPNRILKEISFGSRGYEFNMKVSTKLVALSDAGRSAADVSTKLTPQDEAALQSVMLSMMADREMTTLIQVGMAASMGDPGSLNRTDLSRIDLCRIGHIAIDRLRKLPPETKAHVWAMGMAEARKMVAKGGLPMPGNLKPGGQTAWNKVAPTDMSVPDMDRMSAVSPDMFH